MAKSKIQAKFASDFGASPEGQADAPAHLAFAEALERIGRRDDAIAAYEAAVVSDPASTAARVGLARALLRAGRVAEAFERADSALAADLDNLDAWEVIADALEALGETEFSALACERMSSIAPRRADLHVRLGRLYEALDRPFEAAARYQRGLTLAPLRLETKVEAHLGLSGLFGRAGQFARARAHAETALALAPDSQGAHQNLAVIADCDGRAAQAEAHREAAYRASPFIVTRTAAPRRRVLTLASAARANSPDRYLIPPSRYDRLVWFIGYGDAAAPASREFDVVFNAIADPVAAGRACARAGAFVATCDRPTLNPPDAIARTARDQAQRLFAGIEDLIVPFVSRIDSSSDLSSFSREQPWLLRPLGSHGGERLERLASSALRQRIGAGEHYLTAFHDFRSEDGLYRKYRIFFVDREPFPYHLAIHDDWLVHYQTSGTAANPERLEEERRFLGDPRAAIGARAWRAMGEVARRLDLDFAGVDFAVLPDGRALLFEANATMFVHPEAPDGPLAHKNGYVQAILDAFWRRVETA